PRALATALLAPASQPARSFARQPPVALSSALSPVWPPQLAVSSAHQSSPVPSRRNRSPDVACRKPQARRCRSCCAACSTPLRLGLGDWVPPAAPLQRASQ